jgi:hypothetical protein
MSDRKSRINELLDHGGYRGGELQGLDNDARYHDLYRTYGDYSREVLLHLESCSEVQRRGENHT